MWGSKEAKITSKRSSARALGGVGRRECGPAIRPRVVCVEEVWGRQPGSRWCDEAHVSCAGEGWLGTLKVVRVWLWRWVVFAWDLYLYPVWVCEWFFLTVRVHHRQGGGVVCV